MWRSRLLTGGAAFVIALLVALACVGGRYPPTSYRCWPGGPQPRCPEPDDLCCSDDPAALDVTNLGAAALPDYAVDSQGTGTPLFSAANNDLSDSGLCVRSGSVPIQGALEGGCPIPCNPTWDAASIASVCGPSTICCQTLELEAADCVFDPALGDAGCWRPARGDDITGFGGLEATNWSPDAHATHQDPGGLGCEDFVVGLSAAELDAAGVSASDVLVACYRRLGVANQRGFCLGGAGVNFCPLAQPSHRDPCEQKNDVEARINCG
jgi:hypothetical protein